MCPRGQGRPRGLQPCCVDAENHVGKSLINSIFKAGKMKEHFINLNCAD